MGGRQVRKKKIEPLFLVGEGEEKKEKKKIAKALQSKRLNFCFPQRCLCQMKEGQRQWMMWRENNQDQLCINRKDYHRDLERERKDLIVAVWGS